MNEQVRSEAPPAESDADPHIVQTAQQTNVPASADPPDSTPMDGEAEALLEASHRIGAASRTEEYYSYSSLLVVCMMPAIRPRAGSVAGCRS